jgi:hypothetical protein
MAARTASSSRSPITCSWNTKGMKNLALSFLFLGIIAMPGLALGQEGGPRSASVPHLKVTVSVERTSGGQLMLVEEFTTDSPYQHSVICVSGIYDMQYLLRDSSGNVISKSQRAKEAAPIFGGGGTPSGPTRVGASPIGPMRVGPSPRPDPCRSIGANRQQRRVVLSELYPNLKHGTYTLQATLAPRDSHDRAVLAPPFRITI